jgi:hypothetical protein
MLSGKNAAGRRLDEGVSEPMTTHGRYTASDSSFAQSTGNAATKGLVLIAVAVVIGFLLLWQGGVGGDSSPEVAAADDASIDAGNEDASSGGTDDAPADDGSGDGDDAALDEDSGATTDTTPVTPTTRPLGEVKVAIANGVGVSGLAGQQSELLKTAGFVTIAVNAKNNTELSAVYYVDGYALEAEAVALELGATGAVLRPATSPEELVADPNQIEGFHIFVILGSDRVLG